MHFVLIGFTHFFQYSERVDAGIAAEYVYTASGPLLSALG